MVHNSGMSRADHRRARRVEPDAAARSGDTLADPDYADAFAIDPGTEDRSAEQWARTAFEGAPAGLRWFLLIGWRFVLGIRLGPRPSPQHVLGWPIVLATRDTIVLGVESAVVGPSHLLFRVADGRVVAATFVRFDRPGARAIWSARGLIHRPTLSYLLAHAARTPGPAAS